MQTIRRGRTSSQRRQLRECSPLRYSRTNKLYLQDRTASARPPVGLAVFRSISAREVQVEELLTEFAEGMAARFRPRQKKRPLGGLSF